MASLKQIKISWRYLVYIILVSNLKLKHTHTHTYPTPPPKYLIFKKIYTIIWQLFLIIHYWIFTNSIFTNMKNNRVKGMSHQKLSIGWGKNVPLLPSFIGIQIEHFCKSNLVIFDILWKIINSINLFFLLQNWIFS